MPYLELRVANAGTLTFDAEKGADVPSSFGHVWYHIYQNETDTVGKSYGFSPIKSGAPIGQGDVNVHGSDTQNYRLDTSPQGGDYIGRVYITDEQYETLKEFGGDPKRFGFNINYDGLNNSCIDFTWTGLAKAGLISIDSDGNFFDGDVIPTWNIDNFKKLINSINNSDIGIPTVPNFTLKSPLDFGITDSQFISSIADYYNLDAVATVNSNQEYFSKALGYNEVKITAHSGNISALLKNSDFTLKDINLSNYINIHQDNEGDSFTIVKNDAQITLKDTTTATINDIIDTLNLAKEATDTFMNHYMYQLTSVFTTGSGLAGLISDVNAEYKMEKIQNKSPKQLL